MIANTLLVCTYIIAITQISTLTSELTKHNMQEKPENNGRIWNNGTFIAGSKQM